MAKKKQAAEPKKKIGREALEKANTILRDYKDGKKNLENRIKGNELWYKLRHWEVLDGGNTVEESDVSKVKPKSAWLFNSIENKHADFMDNYPEPNILARTQDDEEVAKALSTIIPVILERNDYEQTYSDVTRYKLKAGTGVKKIFWNTSKGDGLGDVDIKKIDILNVFWQPGVSDIQDSRHFFHVELIDNDLLKSNYPELELSLGNNSPTMDVAKYSYDDQIDTSDKSLVIDWYYKKDNAVHYVKYVNVDLIYASEDDPEYAERGYYDHGQYPFVFDPLFTVEGSPAGFGYIDIMKSPQEYIDKLDRSILQNAMISAKKRYFIKNSSGINEEEYANMENDFIHMDTSLGEDAIREIQTTPLNNVYLTIKQNKIDELKETSNNRDFSQGSTSSGVTAMGAIIALQEAGSKQSRDMIKSSYRAFQRECYLVIELIRQFYDNARAFRIVGEGYKTEYVKFDNTGMMPQEQGNDFMVDLGMRLPIFDIKVSASKKSYFSRESQNQTMLQFYQAGFFNPQLADQALMCLEGMDFEKKEKIIEGIKKNQTMAQQIQMMQQQMLQLATIVDSLQGTTIAQGLMAEQQGIESEGPSGNGTEIIQATGTEKTAKTVNNMSAPK